MSPEMRLTRSPRAPATPFTRPCAFIFFIPAVAALALVPFFAAALVLALLENDFLEEPPISHRDIPCENEPGLGFGFL